MYFQTSRYHPMVNAGKTCYPFVSFLSSMLDTVTRRQPIFFFSVEKAAYTSVYLNPFLSSEASKLLFFRLVGECSCAFSCIAFWPNQSCPVSTVLEWQHYRGTHLVQHAANQVYTIRRSSLRAKIMFKDQHLRKRLL